VISVEKLKSACWTYLSLIEHLFPAAVQFDVQPEFPMSPTDFSNGFGRVTIGGPVGDRYLGTQINQNLSRPILQFSCWAIEAASAGYLAEQILEAFSPIDFELFPAMQNQCVVRSSPRMYLGARFSAKGGIYYAVCDIEFLTKVVS
jgi:hypothetical protein